MFHGKQEFFLFKCLYINILIISYLMMYSVIYPFCIGFTLL